MGRLMPGNINFHCINKHDAKKHMEWNGKEAQSKMWDDMGWSVKTSLVKPRKGMKDDDESEDEDDYDKEKKWGKGRLGKHEGMRMEMMENKKSGRSRMRMSFRDSAVALTASVGAASALYLF